MLFVTPLTGRGLVFRMKKIVYESILKRQRIFFFFKWVKMVTGHVTDEATQRVKRHG